MGTAYEMDVMAWANEQASLLRSGKLSAIDIEHIAEEIEDVGKSEQRELANRMSILLAHLLKWQYQPERQSISWQRTIREQRKAIASHLRQVPSLKPKLENEDWKVLVWADAVSIAIAETGMGNFPEICPWDIDSILSEVWLPS